MTKNNRYTKKELTHILEQHVIKIRPCNNINKTPITGDRDSRPQAFLILITEKRHDSLKKIDSLIKTIDYEAQMLRHQTENLKHADVSLRQVVLRAISKRKHRLHAMYKKLSAQINKCSYFSYYFVY